MSSSLTSAGKAPPMHRVPNALAGRLSETVKLFDAKVAEHSKKQIENPFSNHEGAAKTRPKFSKTDEKYGYPDTGSKSHAYMLKAKENMRREIDLLLDVLLRMAPNDGSVLFKDLFQTYTDISDKLVGVMIFARRAGFINFDGEIMYQGRDDNKRVCMTQAGFDRHREQSLLTRASESRSRELAELVSSSQLPSAAGSRERCRSLV